MGLSPQDTERLRVAVQSGDQRLARKLLMKGGAAGKCQAKKLCFKVTGDACSTCGKWICEVHGEGHLKEHAGA